MEAPRTPAQWYALVVGAVLAVVGVLALVLGSTDFGAGSGTGNDFIIWNFSGWETILLMAVGVLGVFVAARVDSARIHALATGILFAVFAVWGFIDGGDTVAALFSVNLADKISYAVLAVLGIALGTLPESAQRRVGVGTTAAAHSA